MYEKVKLASDFDPNVNKEAARFVQKHGYEKILDTDETNVNCILLVEDLPNFDKFLNVIKKQGYKPNTVTFVNQDLIKLYSLNKITQIEKMYELLDKIFTDVN